MAQNTPQQSLGPWAKEQGVHFDYITPGKPMENGYVESFNGKFREECLNQNWFKNLREAVTIIEKWRKDYNQNRPHRTLGYLTPNEFLKHCAAVHMFTSRLRTYEQPPRGRRICMQNPKNGKRLLMIGRKIGAGHVGSNILLFQTL